MDDAYAPLVEPYALGALDAAERESFEHHLDGGCVGCREALARDRAVLGALPRAVAAAEPRSAVREQLLDLAGAPREVPDLASIEWNEVVPGVRVHVLREDPARRLVACLVWASPGARHPRHRHLGDEVILVLQGALADECGSYGPGAVCRSREGSIHSEVALPGDDCVCYVLYYGGLEMLEETPSS
jgi:putative transcriptional regulator